MLWFFIPEKQILILQIAQPSLIPSLVPYRAEASSNAALSQELQSVENVMMKKWIVCFQLLCIVAANAFSISVAAVEKKPNFVWLVSEDNSPQYIKLFNPTGAAMPSVEALAKDGISYHQVFSNTPVCSTARTTLATGIETPKLMLNYHRKFSPVPLPESVVPISKYLMDNGYYTANNFKTDFNFVTTAPSSIWNESGTSATWRKRKPGQAFFYMQSWSTTHEKNLHFPESDVGTKATAHSVDEVTLPPYYPDTEVFRYTYARYLDRHTAVDKEIAEVIAKLKADDLLEDTFIFYFGDHGGVLPGSKGYINQRGLHVPLVVRIPENFKHLVYEDKQVNTDTRQHGVLNFVDFAPTLANLAGLPLLDSYDGKPFLGKGVTEKDVSSRDSSWSYADRFDEKYDFVRAYRKGRYKYVRHFTPMNTDGLFNEYRYKQYAFREWKALFEAGKLNSIQSSFFEKKPAEALYDLKTDPHETKNLIDQADLSTVANDMRTALFAHMLDKGDLGFYPEYWLVKYAANDPMAFAKKNRAEMQTLMDIANLQLKDFEQVKSQLLNALKSDRPWERYWALINLSAFGDKAISLQTTVKQMLSTEPNILVKARAIEFLTLTSDFDPVAPLLSYINATDDKILVLEIMNIAAVLHEAKGFYFDIPTREAWQKPKKGDDNYDQQFNVSYWLNTRLRYLAKK
ncbi:sulfatase family protein [Agaribacter flavus]|uniref:Sulfatase n=1 Tax=Agaribacter flavus TaxID=1902781 RepID=A0ABV7FKF9_9ALTE